MWAKSFALKDSIYWFEFFPLPTETFHLKIHRSVGFFLLFVQQTQIFTCKTYINSWKKSEDALKSLSGSRFIAIEICECTFQFCITISPASRFFLKALSLSSFPPLGYMCMRTALKAHWMWQECECNDKFKAFLCNCNSFKKPYTHNHIRPTEKKTHQTSIRLLFIPCWSECRSFASQYAIWNNVWKIVDSFLCTKL